MGRNNFFQFKQFRIVQEKAAMKVGIDGVLLGAWANLNDAVNILDIGSGTGLLALMAAQRTNAFIDAVEIESEAAEEANLNVGNSLWKDRICIHNCAFQDFKTERKYTHIISNPPFFDNSLQSQDHKKTKARHSSSLSLDELLKKSARLLADQGKISLILPAEKEEQLKVLSSKHRLKLTRLVYVAPDKNKKPHRILVELSTSEETISEPVIYIRNSENNTYSEYFRELTQEFYIRLA